MITHWDEVEADPARARTHRSLLAGAHGRRTRSPPAYSASRSSPGGGRRRCTSRARRRRSSTSCRARASRSRGTVRRAGASPSARVTVSSTCALEHAHTIGAGDDGLVVLAFGQRHYAANTLAAAGRGFVARPDLGAARERPRITRGRERQPSALRRGRSSAERPARIVNLADVAAYERAGATVGSCLRAISAAPRLGADRARALRRASPGMLMNPPHVHSAEEEIFVVLEGSGTLQLYPSPRCGRRSSRSTRSAPGCTIARPAGTRRAHGIRAGADGLTLLAYGTRDPNDIVLLPALGEDQLSRRRRDRQARAGRLLGWRGLKESGGPR